MDDHITRIEAALAHPALNGHDQARVALRDHAEALAALSRVCNPVAIRALLDRLKAAEKENERLREAVEWIVSLRTGGMIEGRCRAALENTDGTI